MYVDIISDAESFVDSCASSDMELDEKYEVDEREVALSKSKARGTAKSAAKKSKVAKKLRKTNVLYDGAAIEPADVHPGFAMLHRSLPFTFSTLYAGFFHA